MKKGQNVSVCVIFLPLVADGSQAGGLKRQVGEGEEGCRRYETQRETLLIIVKHNMITAVVKTHKPHTHSLSARRRPG